MKAYLLFLIVPFVFAIAPSPLLGEDFSCPLGGSSSPTEKDGSTSCGCGYDK